MNERKRASQAQFGFAARFQGGRLDFGRILGNQVGIDLIRLGELACRFGQGADARRVSHRHRDALDEQSLDQQLLISARGFYHHEGFGELGHLGQQTCREGFCQTWEILDEDVPTTLQPKQQVLQHLLFPDNDLL